MAFTRACFAFLFAGLAAGIATTDSEDPCEDCVCVLVPVEKECVDCCLLKALATAPMKELVEVFALSPESERAVKRVRDLEPKEQTLDAFRHELGKKTWDSLLDRFSRLQQSEVQALFQATGTHTA